MATLNEFYFEIRYIKGKENRVAYALSRRVHTNHFAIMHPYGIIYSNKSYKKEKKDDMYQHLKHGL